MSPLSKSSDPDPAGQSPSISRIAVLPPALADQIAAGEVVERAASVVKELCENAIDAGAHRVEVEIEGGGRRLVRVLDDGCGMTPHEARLALRRHATSKIRSADDLWGLSTFGFRGEALPSIAAVSRLTLATKVSGATAGFQLTVEGGAETEAREVGIPPGTQVEIRDLFFNTPARLKFQKTEATEAANVNEAVLRLALGHPEVHFRLRAGGRLVLDLPVHQKLGERVRAAFARRGAGALHEAQGEEGGHQVRAFLAAPDEASATARATFMFVGRRFIRDRSLLHALALGYGELLDKGRYPLAALFLDVPGPDLDINVHPQKLEVRFARPAEVYAAVRHVVSAGIGRAPWLATARGSTRMHTLPPPTAEGRATPPPRGWGKRDHAHEGSFEPAFTTGGGRVDNAAAVPRHPPAPRSAEGAPANGFFQALSYIGQFQNKYLVCEGPGELLLIDQHAAHELVALQRLRGAQRGGETPGQNLLFPVPVDVGTDGARAAVAHAARLKTLGFQIDTSAGSGAAGDAAGNPGGQVLLRAVPRLLQDADPKPLLRQLLGVMAGDAPDGEGLDAVLAVMACHSVVRAGDVVGQPEAHALLAQLDAVDVWGQRPHGRPVLLRFPFPEPAPRFGMD